MNDKTMLFLCFSRSADQWVILSHSKLRTYVESVISDDMLTLLDIVEDTRVLFTGTRREVSTAVQPSSVSHQNLGTIELLRTIVSIGKCRDKYTHNKISHAGPVTFYA
jgi:hypothetical protein